ncbi:MAG: hypothetical protein K6A44_07770 [bacterium]|nr:hypothetical protein [bacterium]
MSENIYENYKKNMIVKTNKYAKAYGVGFSKTTPAWNDGADAFRHVFMQASQTLKWSSAGASIAGGIHEIMGNINSNQDPRESNMDTWNNAVGREIGVEVRNEIKGKNYSQDKIDEIIARKTYERLKSGDLITDLNDKRDYKKDFKNRKNNISTTNPIPKLEGHVEIDEFKNNKNPYEVPEDKIYTFEEISMMKPEEFRSQQDRILSDFVDRKMIHDYEAAEKVQSGELIYVQPYERTDGTKVNGYYRRK